MFMMSNSKSLITNTKKFLAMGDSLTKGYYCYGTKFHPYTRKLSTLLDGKIWNFQNEGISGQCTDEIYERSVELVNESKTTLYDIVCVLAGTNDIGLYPERPAEETFQQLIKIYELFLSHGSFLITVTIPQSAETDSDYIQCRNDINESIRQYSLQNSSRVVCIDLEAQIPYNTSTGEVNTEYFDDELHLTPLGYDKFGELVFQAISHIKKN